MRLFIHADIKAKFNINQRFDRVKEDFPQSHLHVKCQL